MHFSFQNVSSPLFLDLFITMFLENFILETDFKSLLYLYFLLHHFFGLMFIISLLLLSLALPLFLQFVLMTV